MAITFSADQRKQITGRQLRISLENAANDSTADKLQEEKQKLLKVDEANAVFYDAFFARAQAYELEVQAANGTIAATYTNGQIDPFVAGDLSTSAKSPGSAGALFFPSSPPYEFFVPKVVDAVNGLLNPTDTAARYELNILSNTVIKQGLAEMIFRLENGITGATPTNKQTLESIPGGDLTGFVVDMTNTTDFTVGELVYIRNGSNSGIYRVTAKTPNDLTIDSVLPSSSTLLINASVDNTVDAFTPTERENLTSALYQEILTNLTNGISALVSEWETKVDEQIVQLTANDDDRATQASENTAALNDANNAKSIIDTWQALPNTGSNGKYTAASISPLSSEITARQTFIATRTPQITTALGNVSQNGNDFSGVTGSPYFERYKWLNIRINRASGSATRFFAADTGINFLNTLTADNSAIQNEYDQFFLTKAILFIDDTPIVQVKDVAGLAVGDKVFALSETQPEIERAIITILGTNQIRLDKPIPNTYLIADQARIFKLL